MMITLAVDNGRQGKVDQLGLECVVGVTLTVDVTQTEQFSHLVQAQLQQSSQVEQLAAQVEQIVQQRLDELTPQMVKEIIQQMIREHLGWLVVWGGVFGGVLGLFAALLQR